jgi:hypothetical protein
MSFLLSFLLDVLRSRATDGSPHPQGIDARRAHTGVASVSRFAPFFVDESPDRRVALDSARRNLP